MLVYLGGGTREVLGNLLPSVADKRPADKREGREKGWWESATGMLGGVPLLGSLTGYDGGEQRAEKVDEGARLTFADCSAYLVVTTESLADVSSRLPDGEKMDITKFRPNIVLSGAEAAWDEDWWESVEFRASSSSLVRNSEQENVGREPAKLLLTANCGRCVSINVDYDTGRQGKGEAGTMLKKLMKDRRVDAGNKWSPVFGRYGFLDEVSSAKSTGRATEGRSGQWPVVRIGDEVVIGGRRGERRVWRKFRTQRPSIMLALANFSQNGREWEVTEAGQLLLHHSLFYDVFPFVLIGLFLISG